MSLSGKAEGGRFRLERDAMGEVRIPASAYYGPQTARAVENFPVSGLRFPRVFLRALGLIKKHAALVHVQLGEGPPEKLAAISQAAEEVAMGRWDDHFVVDIFQTGSGTSTNMNANEVIARRAEEIWKNPVHPNDDVNRGQSSNDVMPTALHIAALELLEEELKPSLALLAQSLREKSVEFSSVIKIGRTHLQDATPVTVGQEFAGWASQVEHGLARLNFMVPHLCELPLGGTAVGTGLNAPESFARMTIAGLANETRLPLREAPDHFEAQGARDACVALSGALKVVAVSVIKFASDIRLLASGPRAGIGELRLPATQPGSSIMPGKVNPVMCEMLIQVAAQVLANDTAISLGGMMGNLELNAMQPLIAHNLLESLQILSKACRIFAERCVRGMGVNESVCEANVEKSLAMVTALATEIGYDQAAEIAKRAHAEKKTVREVAGEISGIGPERLAKLLDPERQVRRQ